MLESKGNRPIKRIRLHPSSRNIGLIDIPSDILERILRFLNIGSLARLTQVNKNFYSICIPRVHRLGALKKTEDGFESARLDNKSQALHMSFKKGYCQQCGSLLTDEYTPFCLDKPCESSYYLSSKSRSPLKDPTAGNYKINLRTINQWILVIDYLCKKNPVWLRDCSVVIGDSYSSVINIDKTGKVLFPGNKHTYYKIKQELNNILTRYHINDASLAHELLSRLITGNYGAPFSPDTRVFLDALLLLVFGVESARNKSTFILFLMHLELIAVGATDRSGRLFTFANAFMSQEGYSWDQPNLYLNDSNPFGGNFSMSITGTGAGSVEGDQGRKGLLELNDGFAEHFRTTHHFNVITHREVHTLENWLYYFLPGTIAETSLDIIQLTIERRCQSYFGGNLITLSTDELKRKKQARKDRVQIALYTGMRGQTPLRGDIFCYTVQHTVIKKEFYSNKEENCNFKFNKPYIHRADRPCLLIPDYILSGTENVRNMNGRQTCTGYIGSLDYYGNYKNHQLCPYCGANSPKQSAPTDAIPVACTTDDGLFHSLAKPHQQSCSAFRYKVYSEVNKLSSENKVVYLFLRQAKLAGYKPCPVCYG